MKLGNHGWGTKEMIIMSSILFILLMIVTYYIYAYYRNIGVNTYTYTNLESKLQNAARNYASDNNILVGEVTSRQLMKEGYLSSFVDDNNRECTGYVDINSNHIKPYIKCPKYTTENY